MNEEQKERLNQLTEIVLATTPVREATDEQVVRLPTGDRMALVFHHSAEEPARCALEIAEALQKHPELAGAGINIAQRVMDCGDAGHILLSKRSHQNSPRKPPLVLIVDGKQSYQLFCFQVNS